MTDTQDQIPSIVSDNKAKRPIVRYIVLNVALFLGYYAFMIWATYMIAPLVPGWDECVSEILFRLPTGYLAYRLLKRARPVENPRMIGKKRFRKFQLLYLLLVQLPIKIPSAMFAAGGEWLPQTTGSYMVNANVLGPLVE